MALINRFARLFRADMNAVLDHIEEPTIVLKQALREMEANLYGEQKKLKLVDAEIKMIATKLSSQQGVQQKLQTEIILCLDADNHPLAKNVIRKKLQLEKLIEQLEQKSVVLTATHKTLQDSIQEKQQTLSEIQQKVDLITDNETAVEKTMMDNMPQMVSEDEVEVEFLKLSNANKGSAKKRKAS